MEILLSLPGFHIKPRSNTTASMWLDNTYDLFIDVNKNPGSWTAERKRGGLRTEETLRGGNVPADDIEAADVLIKAYQGALVDRVLELENQDQENEKKELEILRPPKKNRSQGKDQGKDQGKSKEIIFDPEEAAALEILTAPEEARPQEEEVQEEEVQGVQEVQEDQEESSPKDPEEEVQEVKPEEVQAEVKVLTREQLETAAHNLKPIITALGALKSAVLRSNINTAMEQEAELAQKSLRADPDPDIDYLSNEWEDIDKDPELSKKSLLADPGEVQEERSPKGPGLQIKEAVTAAILAPIIPSIKTQIDTYYEIGSEKKPDLKPLNTPEMLNYLNKSAGAPEVQDYDKKIEARFKEIFEALNSEINIAKAETPENNTRADNLSKIYENLEVLQLLQALRQRQALQRQGQGPGPQEEALKINELRITRNPSGYSWKTILRGESLEELLEAGLKANERLIKELK